MSTPFIIGNPPPIKPNRFRRWLGTSTAKAAIAFIAAGATAVVSPEVGLAVAGAADGLSKGDSMGVTTMVVGGVLAYFRSRSV